MASPVDFTKVLDPSLNESDYIDMSGAHSIRRASRNSADMEMFLKKSSTVSPSSDAEITSRRGSVSSEESLELSPTEKSAVDIVLPLDNDNKKVDCDDTYVTISGSHTYLSHHCCDGCFNDVGDNKECRECTYMSIESEAIGELPAPPELPARQRGPATKKRRYSEPGACVGRTAKVLKLSTLAPRKDEVLTTGNHQYTLQDIFDSVNQLTKGLDVNDVTENRPSMKRKRYSDDFVSDNESIINQAIYEDTEMDSKAFASSILRRSSKSRSRSSSKNRWTYPYTNKENTPNLDTYDTFQTSIKKSKIIHECITEEYSYTTSPSAESDVKLPISTKKKTKRRRSFLDHIGSMGSSFLSRPKLYSIHDHSTSEDNDSTFVKKLMLKSSLKAFKKDMNNNKNLTSEVLCQGFINHHSRETIC